MRTPTYHILGQIPLSRLLNDVVDMVELYLGVSERIFLFVLLVQVEGEEEKMDVDADDHDDDELVRGNHDFPS